MLFRPSSMVPAKSYCTRESAGRHELCGTLGERRDTVRSPRLTDRPRRYPADVGAPDSAVRPLRARLLRRTLTSSHLYLSFSAARYFLAYGEILCADAFSTIFDGARKSLSCSRLRSPQGPLRLLRRTLRVRFFLFYQKQRDTKMVSLCFWRRRRDSNSRTSFPAYSLSRGAPSTYLGTSPYSIQLCRPSCKAGAKGDALQEAEFGGEGGIRTHGSFESLVFKTSSLNRSDTSPCMNRIIIAKKIMDVNCFFIFFSKARKHPQKNGCF